MTSSLMFNLFTAMISLFALVVSSVIAMRQARYQRSANHVPVMADIMRSFRSAEFREEIDYVEYKLLKEHDSRVGLSGLPDEVKNTVLNVIYFYQYVAIVVILDICDSAIMTHYFGRRVVRAWRALSPFIEVERLKEAGRLGSFYMLEEFAVRCSHVDLDSIRQFFRLRSFNQNNFANVK